MATTDPGAAIAAEINSMVRAHQGGDDKGFARAAARAHALAAELLAPAPDAPVVADPAATPAQPAADGPALPAAPGGKRKA